MPGDFEACYRALLSKDARFDGWFFAAVASTGIYCRPSCPATTPKRDHIRIYPTAAAAQRAGFRACKRCRPDAAPGSPEWDARADVVARAVRLVADGVVDREGVPGLARRLGYGVRQVQRVLMAELGAGPVALARAQRAQAARLLIETTALPFGQVAFAAGFSSVRQFNDTVREVFALTPTDLRRRAGRGRRTAAGEAPAAGAITLRLPFRTPYEPHGVFGHLVATAVPGVEEWDGGAYRRTLDLPHGPGVVSLRPRPDHVATVLRLADLRDLSAAVARCRRLLDLDADPVAVDSLLAGDEVLAPLVAKLAGRRVPRTVDGAELAVRAVIGQQVSTAAARTHTAHLVERAGTPLPAPDGTLRFLFPRAAALVDLPAGALAVPAARRRTVAALTGALAEGRLDLEPGADWARARRALDELPGVGPWTAGTITMRALGDPDAFLPGDLGVRRAAHHLGLPAGRGLVARAERWRPWRAYAVQYLWGALDHPINRLPEEATCPPPPPSTAPSAR